MLLGTPSGSLWVDVNWRQQDSQLVALRGAETVAEATVTDRKLPGQFTLQSILTDTDEPLLVHVSDFRREAD